MINVNDHHLSCKIWKQTNEQISWEKNFHVLKKKNGACLKIFGGNAVVVNKDNLKGKCSEWSILYLIYKLLVSFSEPTFDYFFKGDAPFMVLIWQFFEKC